MGKVAKRTPVLSDAGGAVGTRRRIGKHQRSFRTNTSTSTSTSVSTSTSAKVHSKQSRTAEGKKRKDASAKGVGGGQQLSAVQSEGHQN